MDEKLIPSLFLEAMQLKEYEILQVEKLVGSYGHASWKFTTAQQTFLFKVNIRNMSNRDLENEILAHQLLAKTGLSVPQILYSSPMPNILGRPYYIQSWLSGVDARIALPELNTESRQKFAHSFGIFVAKMHQIESKFFSHSLHKNPDEKSLDWKAFIFKKLERFILDIRTGNFLPDSFLFAVEKKARSLIDNLESDVKPGFTHMDLYLANAIVNTDKLAALLDFESACFYDPIWDFVKLDAWVFQKFSDLRQPFLQGYTEITSWKSTFGKRIFAYQGVEYLAAFPYFGTRFPDKKMFNNFYQLLETWLGLTKLDEYEK